MLGGRVTTREEAFDILCCQLARPSRWDSMLNAMWTDGCHKFIEAGPGHVLARMLRWTLRQAKVQVLEDPMSIERFVMGRHTPGFEPARPGMEGEPS
jgi:malonyl CoA-acyl carrier protein transacylase